MLSVKTPTINVETAEHLRCSDEFTKIAQDSAIEMLSDPESRVRIAAGIAIDARVYKHIEQIQLAY